MDIPQGIKPQHGENSLRHVWPYRAPGGAPLGFVARYDGLGGDKAVIPYFRKNGAGWMPGGPPELRPVFGLDVIYVNADQPVVVVEGEKCAAALQSLGLVAVTSQGGSSSADKADWTVLSGRRMVYILPDNDPPGEAYARAVWERLMALPQPPEVRIVRLPDLPAKGDVVDWLQARLPDWDGFQPVPEGDRERLREELVITLKELAEAPPAPDHSDDVPLRQWPALPINALYGIAGEVVDLGTAGSEADPAAILMQFLCWFGAQVGHGPHTQRGDDKHCARLFLAVVGRTARARKGTSKGIVERIMREVEQALIVQTGNAETMVVSHGPLSTGEGLIFHVRDATHDKAGEIDDPGIVDKRLLVVEGEFASTLAVMQREGNTLSEIIRDAWDVSEPWQKLAPMTKTNRIAASNPHICLIGHITRAELGAMLTGTDLFNGFANRFLWCCVRRARIEPNPEPMPSAEVIRLAGRIAEAIRVARDRHAMLLNEEARQLWEREYPRLTVDHPGPWGAATCRAEAQVIRLALIYALLDSCPVINALHLRSALAVWSYCEASAKYLFHQVADDAAAKRILAALQGGPMTQNQLRDLFGRNKSSAELGEILENLAEVGAITGASVPTTGRPKTVWTLTPGFTLDHE